MKKKALALILALTLLVTGIVAGTLAWLTDTSDTVTNTFKGSNVTVKLEETKGTVNGTNREFKMVPGYTIAKDPKAWVAVGSEDCYLFVELEFSENFTKFLECEIADGWIALSEVTGETVFYRIVKSSEMGESHKFSVLKDDQVTVIDTLGNGDFTGTFTQPTLKVTAKASQLYKNEKGETFTPIQAWNNMK